MKFLEIALLGLGAYLILKGGSSTVDSGGGFVPGTGLLASGGMQEKIKQAAATENIKSPSALLAKSKEPLGEIFVRAAPLANVSPSVKSEVTSIFQKQYLTGGFVPSSALTGKLTKTDIIIAGNLAKKSFNMR